MCDVWCVMCDVWRRDDSGDRRGSNNNIISSLWYSLASQHLYHQNIWPFLVLPGPRNSECGEFLSPHNEGGMFPSSERKLSLDTFGNLTKVSSEICKTKYNSLLVSEFRLCVNHKSLGLGSWLQPSQWFTAPGHNISNFQDLTIYFTLSFTYLVSERI